MKPAPESGIRAARPYGQEIHHAALSRRSALLGHAFLRLWATKAYRALSVRRDVRKLEEFPEAAPATPQEARIVADLKADGIAFSSMDEFFPPEVYARFRDWYEGKLDAYLAAERQGSAAKASTEGKPYIIRLASKRGYVLDAEDPAFPICSSPAMARIACAHLGLVPRLGSLDVWYTRPYDSEKPLGSQQWHRDYNDTNILRVFLYFNDVDLPNGALQYVSGSHTGGPLRGAFTGRKFRRHGMYRYIADAEFEAEAECVRKTVVAKAPSGGLIFCDTSGLHRGGKCLDGVRKMFLMTYTSNYDLRPEPPSLRASLRPPQDGLVREILGY